jgi:hypothetical protein
MWNVNIPDNKNSINDLTTAFTYLDGELKFSYTCDDIKIVNRIYSLYDKVEGKPHNDLLAEEVSKVLKSAVEEAYNEVQSNRRLSNLRSAIILSANRCPCCGINAADELDHHLPKSVYKLLAVYARNLVPICHKCNNLKRALTGIREEERFIHVYYEKLPNVQFFFANVSWNGKGINSVFFIKQIKGMSDILFNRLEFQITRIKLNERLSKEVNIYLSSLNFAFSMAYGETNNVDNLKRFIEGQAKSNEIEFGINDWRTVIMYGLLSCQEFCDGGFKISPLG